MDRAGAKIDSLDLEALVSAVLRDVVDDLDLENIVERKLDEIDVESLIRGIVTEQLRSNNGGRLGGLLFGR